MKLSEKKRNQMILSINNPDALAILVIVEAYESKGETINPIDIRCQLKISPKRFNSALKILVEKQGDV